MHSTEGTSVIPEKQAGIEIFNCNDDFISINSIRLCGERFNDGRQVNDLTLNAVVTDITNGPIVLPIQTNDEYAGRGFRVNYKQAQCKDAPPMTTEAPTTDSSGDGDSSDTNADSVIGSKIYNHRFHHYKQEPF